MPPAPSSDTISYSPRRAPAGSCKCGADYSGPRARATALPRRLVRNLAIEIRGVVREGRHDDRRLLNVFLLQPLDRVHVGVVGADVVVHVILNRIESRHTRVDEAEVIGRPDRLDVVAARAEALERFEPAVEDRAHLFVVLQIPAVDRA